jgi:hypothetical protein
MTKLIGNLVFGQSGGPTSVINSSAAGVFLEALDHPELIQNVYGMRQAAFQVSSIPIRFLTPPSQRRRPSTVLRYRPQQQR